MREADHTRRVVITGLGIVSPIGNDPASVWTSLTEMNRLADRQRSSERLDVAHRDDEWPWSHHALGSNGVLAIRGRW